MAESRRNIYIACEDMNMVWCESEVVQFERMWNDGWDIEVIANALDRDPDEVIVLVIDRARNGHIRSRKIPYPQQRKRSG